MKTSESGSVSEKRKKILDTIQKFCLMDDDFMTKVFEDNIEAVELVLRIILERADLRVKTAITQYTIKNLQGRSVRLDIKAEDAAGKQYDVEIQRADKGAGSKRARYNSSLIDANYLLPGDEFERLPETYVIFIAEHDIVGKGLPVYHIERTIQETGALFHDESHIIYVNGAFRGNSDIGHLMEDFSCTDPDKMYFSVLSNRVKYFKETEEGVKTMCRIVENLCDESREEGRNEGRILSLCSLVYKKVLSLKDAEQESGLDMQDFLAWMKRLYPDYTAQ